MPQSSSPSWWGRLSTSMKAMIITVSAIVAIGAIAITAAMMNRPDPAPVGADGVPETVAADSHYLDEVGDDAPTVVEFLDFECEACGALYPYFEEIRKEYDGQINYVVRYYPLPGHFNSMNAAVAVEAAAQQGEFEAMYHQMFETQSEWGEGQTSEAERFRGYAEQLGLDMEAYDAAVADPATQARVEADREAGERLGVAGTPTVFVDGVHVELAGPQDLPEAIDSALGK